MGWCVLVVLAHDTNQWRALMNKVTNLCVPENVFSR
jgi:hypothetical protein